MPSKDIEKRREASRRSYQNHKEDYKRKQKERYRLNEKTRNRIKKQASEWTKNNPEKRSLIMSQQNAKRRARIKENGYEKITVKEWMAIVKLSDKKCIYCRSSEKLVVDHFIPISKGGGHLKINIVPACNVCNSSKWNRLPKDWIKKKFDLKTYRRVLRFIEEIKLCF